MLFAATGSIVFTDGTSQRLVADVHCTWLGSRHSLLPSIIKLEKQDSNVVPSLKLKPKQQIHLSAHCNNLKKKW